MVGLWQMMPTINVLDVGRRGEEAASLILDLAWSGPKPSESSQEAYILHQIQAVPSNSTGSKHTWRYSSQPVPTCL